MMLNSNAEAMKKHLLVSLLLPLVFSCIDMQEQPDFNEGDMECYAVTVEMDLPQNAADTRSAFTEEDLKRITDLNVFIYHDGALLDCCDSYFEDMNSIMLAFPCDKDGFNIYMVGNVGRIEAPVEESEIGDICYMISTYEDFRTRGFPIANVFRNHVKGTRAVFGLKRLVGQYDIKMKTSAADAEYLVKDVRLKNCALDIYPFGTDKKASLFTTAEEDDKNPQGDSLTEEDLAALNSGETVSLYFIENLQGELLPGNTDRRRKIPSSLDEKDQALSDRCTYIEITADVSTPSAEYTDGKYRFYLGQNETTDFSICRNTLYGITLDFTQNMVCEEEWRIEVDEPQVKTLTLSKETAHVIKGVKDFITIRGPRVEIDEEMSDENDGTNLSYYLSDVDMGGDVWQRLTVETNHDLEGYYNWGTDYTGSSVRKYSITLKMVETYNGLPLDRKTLTVYAHDRIFPLLIRMDTNSSTTPYQLEALTDAPVYFNFNLSAAIKADVGNTGSVSSYTSSSPVKGKTKDGYNCCYAKFLYLYNSSLAQDVYFKDMEVTLSGKSNNYTTNTSLYMDDIGKMVYSPWGAPASYSGNISGTNTFSVVLYNSDGTAHYKVYDSKSSGFLFDIDTKNLKGFQCSDLNFDWDEFNKGSYMPFYICNGGHVFFHPYETYNQDPPFVNGSGVVGFLLKSYVPGRDVFYPNGTEWGSSSELRPDSYGKYGYTGEHKRQVTGKKNWTTYSDYECEFFMTINGYTAWPGGSSSKNGFQLP